MGAGVGSHLCVYHYIIGAGVAYLFSKCSTDGEKKYVAGICIDRAGGVWVYGTAGKVLECRQVAAVCVAVSIFIIG